MVAVLNTPGLIVVQQDLLLYSIAILSGTHIKLKQNNNKSIEAKWKYTKTFQSLHIAEQLQVMLYKSSAGGTAHTAVSNPNLILFCVHHQLMSLTPMTCAKHRHRETDKYLSRPARNHMAYLTSSACQKGDGDDKMQTLLLSTWAPLCQPTQTALARASALLRLTQHSQFQPGLIK